MWTKPIFLVLLLLAAASAQERHKKPPKGVIYGIVIGQDGEPGKGLLLEAEPLGPAIITGLPHTKTNDAGEYRFDNLLLGRYTVYAIDETAGYSAISTGPDRDSEPPGVEITPERPKAEFNVSLPPKAGFVKIHLTNRRNGAAISGMVVAVMTMEKPNSSLFTMSCHSDRTILVPSDKNLLLHVKSDGFREWDESVATGKPVNVPSGGWLTLDIQLDPSN